MLVHGPTTWACAIRLPDGSLKVAAERKRVIGNRIENPLFRGPARLVEAIAVLPALKRRLPEAQLPFENPRILGAMLGSAVGVRAIRGSRLAPAAQELAAGMLALAPALLSLRGNELAAYHGAEHISIGSYEHDEPRARGARALRVAPDRAADRDDRRCERRRGGPCRCASAGPPARVASLGAIAAATELFGWMVRNPEKKLARALAKPGHELQHRYATKEPSPEQVEVAEAALQACLELEAA